MFWPLGLGAGQGPVDALLGKADAVVVADVQPGNSTSLALTVVRPVKGNPTAGATLSISKAASPCLSDGLGAQHGIWFLTSSGTQWALLPSHPSTFHSSCGIPLPAASSASSVQLGVQPSTASDYLAAELLAGLRSYSGPSQLSSLTSELLGINDSGLITGIYQALHSSSDPELRFIGVTGLLGSSDNSSALAEVAGNLALVQTLSAKFFLVSAICGVTNPDPAAVRSVGQIASSQDVQLQRCAAMALMYIHTPAALPFLAQLLGSSDAATREEAIRGLSRFVDNLPPATQGNMINGVGLTPQGPAPYRTADTAKYSLSTTALSRAPFPEAVYLQFWTTWWATMKDKLATGAQ